MAERILDEAVVKVGVQSDVVEKLARLDAEFKTAMESFGRKEATIHLKGNIDELKASLAEAKRAVATYDAEIKTMQERRDRANRNGNDILADEIAKHKTLRGQAQQELEQLAIRTSREEDYFRLKQKEWTATELEDQKQRTRDRYAENLAKSMRDNASRDAAAAKQRARDREAETKASMALANQRERALSDAARAEETRHLNRVTAAREELKLQQQYADAAARLDRLSKASTISQGSDKQRVELQTADARLQMLRLHEQLALIGRDPIKIKVEADTSVAQKALGLFMHGTTDETNHAKGSLESFKELAGKLFGTKINIGPFNASIGGIAATLGSLAPIVASVVGAMGSLVSVMGSGVAGAAGLGGAGLSGFALAALGIKAATSQAVLQLSTFKSALNTYQTASLKTGPPGLTPAGQAAAARRQAQVPLISQRVSLDQQRLNTAIGNYGSNSTQAASASLALASAQQRLTNAQMGTTTGTNATSKALAKLNMVIAQSSPQMRTAERAWLSLSSVWSKLTNKTAQVDVGSALSSTFIAANANVKWFARDTNKAMDSLSSGWGKWMGVLAKPEAKNILHTLFSNFNATIKPMMDGIGNISAAMGRWFATMSKYLPSFTQSFDDWAKRVNDASKATDGWANHAPSLINSLKSIAHFGEAAGKWLIALFAPGVKPGQSFLDDMTNSLNRTSAAMRTVQGQKGLSSFFSQSTKGTEQLWHALEPLGAIFMNLAALFAPLAKAMVPILGAFTQMVADVTKATGPFGTLLVQLAAFLAVGRLIGKLGPMFGAMGQLKAASGYWARMVASVEAVKGASGGLGGRLRAGVEEWKSASANAKMTASQTIEEALKVGGADAAQKILSAFEEGGSVAASRMAGGIARAGGVAGAEIGTAEIEAAKVSSITSGGVMLPRGAKGLAPLESAAVPIAEGAGISTASKVTSSLGKAAGIAGIGIIGSQMVGQVVGGSAGKGISRVGSFASAGAALGSIVPGVGTIAGGVAGGLIGGISLFIHKAKDFGQQFADGFSKGFGDKAFKQRQTNQANQYQTDTQRQVDPNPAHRVPYTATPGRAANPNGAPGLLPLTPAQVAKAEQDANAWGQSIAGQLEKGWNQYKFQSRSTMITQLQAEIKNPKLPMSARAAAVSSAVNFAKGLESQGRLTKGSAQKLLNSAEAEFPGLVSYLGKTARQASTAFKVGMNLDATRKATKATLDKMRGDFPEVVAAMDDTKGGIEEKSKAVIASLQRIIKYGTKPMREQAKKDLAALVANQNSSFGAITKNIRNETPKWVKTVSSNSNQAYQIGAANFTNLAKAIASMIGAGATATAAGLKNITDQVNAQLKVFGGGLVSQASVKHATAGQLAALVSGQVNAGGFMSPHATGGREVARVPGGVGPDNWTLVDPNGVPSARVGGGELLIANRHTERKLDVATKMVYGKSAGELVANEHTPHMSNGFATGGRLKKYAGGGVVTASNFGGPGDPGTGSTGYRGDNLYSHPDSFAELNMGTALGNLPYMSPITVTLGNKTAKLFKRDIGAGGAGLNGHTRAVDVWFQAAQALGLNGLADVTVNGGAGVNVKISGGGGAAAPTWKNIKSPHVDGGGSIGMMAQHALDKVVKAANAFGTKKAAAAAPKGGGAGGSQTMVAPPGSKPAQVETAMLAAANHIMGRPYVWGGGHGAWESSGYDCSGAVSYVLHAGGFLNSPQTTDTILGSGFDHGPGKYITIGDSPARGHMMMNFFGKYLESGGGGPFGGGGVHWDPGWDGNFEVPLHPRGFATGGRTGDFGEVSPSLLAKRTPGLRRDPKFKRYAKNHDNGSSKPMAWAGEFAQGGSFTTNGPTMGLFGEAGPETVIAIPHASTGFRTNVAHASTHPNTGARARHPAHGTSHAKSHRTTPARPSLSQQYHAIVHGRALDDQEEAAWERYNNFLERLGTVTKRHLVGHPAYVTHTGLGKNKKAKVHKSTLHNAGGITRGELLTLRGYYQKYQNLAGADAAYDKTEGALTATALDIPAKDRIGGIGVEDIVQALTTANNEASLYHKHITHKTDKKHHHVPPTKTELRKARVLDNEASKLSKMLHSANKYVANFTDIENVDSLLGQYMDIAAASPDGTAVGFNPGVHGDTPAVQKKAEKLSWQEWKDIRTYWTNKHAKMLSAATNDVTRIVGKEKHRNTVEVGWAKMLMGDAATATSDQLALAGTADPSESLDTFITQMPFAQAKVLGAQGGSPGRPEVVGKPAVRGHYVTTGTGKHKKRHWVPGHKAIKGVKGIPAVANQTASDVLARLNYQYSVDQGKVILDDPGTAAREDIISMKDEIGSAKALQDFYAGVYADAVKDHPNDYPLLTSASDALNAARSNYMSLNQTVSDANAITGPTQVQMSDTARAAVLQTYGSNIAPVAGASRTSSALASGQTVSAAFNPGANPGVMPSGSTTAAGNSVTINNHYLHQPEDPHSWSQALSWELGASL